MPRVTKLVKLEQQEPPRATVKVSIGGKLHGINRLIERQPDGSWVGDRPLGGSGERVRYLDPDNILIDLT